MAEQDDHRREQRHRDCGPQRALLRRGRNHLRRRSLACGKRGRERIAAGQGSRDLQC